MKRLASALPWVLFLGAMAYVAYAVNDYEALKPLYWDREAPCEAFRKEGRAGDIPVRCIKYFCTYE